MKNYKIAALYKFVSLADYVALQKKWLPVFEERGILGTVLLAEEGLNGTITGEPKQLDAVLAFLREDERLADLEAKFSYADFPPFYRLKIRLKKEIVTIGRPEADPLCKVGTYVDAKEWNALISDPEVLLVDTRNSYEYDIGTFKGALNPFIETFRDFPEYVETQLDPKKHKRVAMFCTGGIRCEKATAFLLQHDFEEVYHLKGGILKYLEEVPEEESLWEGECFVFDNRVAVNHDLEVGSYELCHACRHPISEAEMASEDYEPGASCPHCKELTSDEKKERARERQHQIELAKKRGDAHLGKIAFKSATP